MPRFCKQALIGGLSGCVCLFRQRDRNVYSSLRSAPHTGLAWVTASRARTFSQSQTAPGAAFQP